MSPLHALLAAAALALALPAAAQVKGTVTGSEPGRAAGSRTTEVRAEVVSTDSLVRSIRLKGAEGTVFDVMAAGSVRNFEAIKPGDFVKVVFTQALALDLARLQPGAAPKFSERTAPGGARQIDATMKVTAVDAKAKTISLTGPRGNVVTLALEKPEHFKVKVGDEVRARYTEATALSVEPASRK
jgi:hypothetical protein